jgi:serine/threonine protein kinase
MGEVYRARDTRLGRDVAIKILPAQLAADAERLRRFEQEARAAAALNDPNIMAIASASRLPVRSCHQKRTIWKSLGPADWTGAPGASIPVVSGDGKHYADLVNRSLADLYVVSGLK